MHVAVAFRLPPTDPQFFDSLAERHAYKSAEAAAEGARHLRKEGHYVIVGEAQRVTGTLRIPRYPNGKAVRKDELLYASIEGRDLAVPFAGCSDEGQTFPMVLVAEGLRAVVVEDDWSE